MSEESTEITIEAKRLGKKYADFWDDVRAWSTTPPENDPFNPWYQWSKDKNEEDLQTIVKHYQEMERLEEIDAKVELLRKQPCSNEIDCVWRNNAHCPYLHTTKEYEQDLKDMFGPELASGKCWYGEFCDMGSHCVFIKSNT